jgi:hypothetical protein
MSDVGVAAMFLAAIGFPFAVLFLGLGGAWLTHTLGWWK